MQTSYRIALNKPGVDKRKAYASKLLSSYKWTEKQQEYLLQMEEKGYFIGKYNDAAKAFGLNPVTNGEKRCLMVYGYYSAKPENKKQQITII